MYRSRLWTLRQFSGFGDPEKSNDRLRYLIEKGNRGLSIAFDTPTLFGMDSDNEQARGEVGRLGVPIDSVHDMMRLFDGIDLGKVSTSLVCGFPPIMAMYAGAAIRTGVKPAMLRGTMQNDVFTYTVASFILSVPFDASFKLSCDVIEYCARNIPAFYPVSHVGYHMRDKGATAVQEMAFTIAGAIEYVKALVDRGLDVDEFAPRLSFMFEAQMDLFEEIAKYRAARKIWAHIMRDRFGASNPKSMTFKVHTQTAGSSLTAQQPENNIIRTTIEALAAVLGGTQSLHTNSWDEALALPTESAVKTAIRTQQIIAEETNVASTVDPLGGSYYVEHLTGKLKNAAEELIGEIDEMGGMRQAVKDGTVQRRISAQAQKVQSRIESGDQVVVGVNRHVEQSSGDSNMEILRINPELEQRQLERLADMKKRRDSDRARRSMDALRKAAQNDENVMTACIDAAVNDVTLQEMWDVFRDVWGHDVEQSILSGGTFQSR